MLLLLKHIDKYLGFRYALVVCMLKYLMNFPSGTASLKKALKTRCYT